MSTDEKEKFLLLQILMTDIRMDFSVWARQDARVDKCIDLAFDLHSSFLDNEHSAADVATARLLFKVIQRLGVYLTGRYEGGYLRASFDEGGYEGMEEKHGLPFTPTGRSAWLCRELKQYLKTEFSWDK